MTTGIVVPASPWVCALNALQNSTMLMPCWPSAGPPGGAGEAAPRGACGLMVARTFFAMALALLPPHEAGDPERALDELPGVVAELHVHEDVAGHGALLLHHLLPVLPRRDGLGRHDDVADRALLVQPSGPVLEVLLDLVLEAGVGVDD